MNELIRAEKLSYIYPGRGQVLNEASLSLNSGEVLSLEGANGVGKTTLFNLLVGLNKAKSGTLYAFGKERKVEADFIDVRAKAGLLFQDPDDQLFCPTVLEDVAFGPLNLGKSRDEAKQVALEMLDQLGMQGFEERITYQLSGGEKRMIALASVLAMQPEVLLLDEPSNALDEQSRLRLIQVLKKLPQAMIIISHESSFLAELVTRRLHLENGVISERGTF